MRLGALGALAGAFRFFLGKERVIMRAFIALPVPGVVESHVAQLRKTLSREGVGGKWVRKDGVHLTLHFLGEIGDSEVGALRMELAAMARGISPLRFRYGGVAGFGKPPKLLYSVWDDVESGAFEALVRGVQRSVLAAGLGIDEVTRKRRPVPHLTFVRFRGRHESKALRSLVRIRGRDWEWQIALPAPAVEEVGIERFCLYRSTLTPKGAIYDELASFALGRG